MTSILKRIIAHKRREVSTRKRTVALGSFRAFLIKGSISSLEGLFPKGRVSIIGEIKRKSPVAGRLMRGSDVSRIARLYGIYCAAVSVLTDGQFFGGSLRDIEKVKKFGRRPVLQKDFIVDEYQIYEARRYGADLVLLIAAVLSQQTMRKFVRTARRLGMHALVEVRTLGELRKALRAGAELIGVNSRNLKTFSVDLSVVKRIARHVPKNKIVIAESGIRNRGDIDTLRPYVRGFLIGTSILKSLNAEKLLRSFTEG